MATIKLVKSKSEIGEGLFFNVEGLKRLGDLFIVHGWIVDQHNQLSSIIITKPGTSKTFDLADKLVRFQRPDVNSAYNAPDASTRTHFGFAATVEGMAGARDYESLGIVFVAKSGNAFVENIQISSVTASTDYIPQLLGIIPDTVVDAERCAKFFQPLFLEIERESPKAEKAFDETYGKKVRVITSTISIIIPLYGGTRFEQAQIPAFAALHRPDWELIFAVDDPRIVSSVRDNAKRLASLYGMTIRVIAPVNNLGFSGINNFASEYAKAPILLFLNSDCFISNVAPIQKGLDWLQTKQAGAVGFRLTFSDCTVQHDGMSVSKWNGSSTFLLNDHPRRGLPVNLVPSHPANDEACMITAACLMISKENFKAVGNFDKAYLRGDFEDSDLCLKLIAKDLKLGIVRENGIFHLERQTISEQEGGLRTKITLVNSYIYTQKWQAKLLAGLPSLEVVV